MRSLLLLILLFSSIGCSTAKYRLYTASVNEYHPMMHDLSYSQCTWFIETIEKQDPEKYGILFYGCEQE